MSFYKKNRLFCPGPTPVPTHSALKGLQSLEVYHRSQSFGRDFLKCRQMLAPLFGCHEPPLILTSSGTGAMEALLRHITAPEDKVVVVEGGKFGERWSEIARAYKLSLTPLTIPWGQDISCERLLQTVEKAGGQECRAVFLQASETSTGVYYNISKLSRSLRQTYPHLYIAVDAISSIGAHKMCMDAWQLDGVVSGSQKGFGVPPGLSFIALSERAWQHPQHHPQFYTDLLRERRSQEKGFSAWTPATSLVFTLKASLEEIHERGLENMLQAHKKASQATKKAIKTMGLRLFAQSPCHSLTSIYVPKGVDGLQLLAHAQERYGVTFAGGQGKLKGKIIRLAHLGFFDALDLIAGLAALEMSLKDLGYPVNSGLEVLSEALR